MKNITKKVFIETLGCQMNKADTETILGILQAINYERTEKYKEADLLIINTCTIRGSAEEKAFSHLGVWGKLKRSKPEVMIAICGCVAQQYKRDIFKRAPYVDIVFGTHNIEELPFLIEKVNNEEKKQCSILQEAYQGVKINHKTVRDNNITAWVNIIEGCDYFCSYCIVPYVRGRQRSRDFNEIITEIKTLADDGFKEVTLLGQTVDSYGKDTDDANITLPNLLRELNKIEKLQRIRFVTSHPKDITDELIDTVNELDKVCEYFHIPMQSGNTHILDKMKRGYTAEEYYNLVNKIKTKIKGVSITSDFIVAFPGETEEYFKNTLKAVEDLTFDQCNTAMYSPRKRTAAATWKDIQLTKEIKRERINILNDYVKKSAYIANEKMLNTTQEILIESYSENNNEVILCGRTRNNKITHLKGDKKLIGEIVKAEITDITAWSIRGKIIS